MSTTPIISMQGISKRFVKPVDTAGRIANLMGANNVPEIVHAVNQVDLDVHHGEVVGLVGESGCGKSTLGRVVAGIHQPSEGAIYFEGQDLHKMAASELKKETLAVQMIFQDPMASLNPRMRVLDIVGEAPVYHGIIKRGEMQDHVAQVLERVGLDPVYMRRYPHQFSGGQRARIGIARALAVNPRFLVCDESVAALDVSIQAQVLNLFLKLRHDLNLTYLFISHDLSVVRYLSDRVVIMYLGRVVESAPSQQLFEGPNHPYAQALLDNVPSLANRNKRFSTIKGEIPSPLNPPSGCHFHPRCPKAGPRCKAEAPVLKELAPQHLSACHLNDGGVQ
ncbi:ABC transporter ATP-binding protein [Orrella marina]|uniref:Peptide ABC transporter ATP-binding protein n=1 Tax=Orrella marina TaxID=2163011 RepID=A0A2R4XK62_9BURK|nr:ABC transporter ATP-binding protein [Orrella marina]AWB34222.1 peptide ABC transporter ATP-binding protein [Orrella marina]